MKSGSAVIPQDADKFILRLPTGMRDRVKERAARNYRSMNSEMVVMLQRELDRDQTKAATEAGTSIAAE